jgi:hypothetical protein
MLFSWDMDNTGIKEYVIGMEYEDKLLEYGK